MSKEQKFFYGDATELMSELCVDFQLRVENFSEARIVYQENFRTFRCFEEALNEAKKMYDAMHSKWDPIDLQKQCRNSVRNGIQKVLANRNQGVKLAANFVDEFTPKVFAKKLSQFLKE